MWKAAATMISEPDPATRGRANHPHSPTRVEDHNGDGGDPRRDGQRRNGIANDSLWSVVRLRLLSEKLFDAAEWHLRVARFHGRAGRTTSAEARYRKILSRHPDRLDALIGLGRLLLRVRRYDEAAAIWQRAAALEPDDATLAFQLARALHRNGELERAADHYLHVATRQPTHEKAIAALEQIGKRLVRADASASHTTGMAAAAEIGHRLWMLGGQRALDGATTIAGAIVDSVSKLAPHTPETALARYDAALRAAPDFPEALRRRGRLLRATGSLRQRARCLESTDRDRSGGNRAAAAEGPHSSDHGGLRRSIGAPGRDSPRLSGATSVTRTGTTPVAAG